MTNEDMQRLGQNSMGVALASFGVFTQGVQSIAQEVADYSKKSAESSTAAWERLMGARSLEKAMEVQSDYLKSSYESFVSEATKLGDLYADLAKEAYRQFEGALAKSPMAK